MPKLPWTPWHQVVSLRPEILQGDLTLKFFAASLYDVVMDRGSQLYREPAQFFGLTHTTDNLKDLACDILQRLAGQNDHSVRQLALTYGGGKTHALITLYHLVNDPSTLPYHLPSVDRIVSAAEMRPPATYPPKALVAVLPFDELDPVKGMDVRGPNGAVRRLRLPWSVLAWQLGEEEGMEILGCTDGTEREVPPFTGVLEELLGLPARKGLATLVLVDEVIMWARTMIDTNPAWRERIQDFFQCLTQAASRVERCAVVASLLAADPRKNDEKGRELARNLEEAFRRGSEPSVEPVAREDVAQVLRRRFFTPESTADSQKFVARVEEALKGIADLDEATTRDMKGTQSRYWASYPFHPELIDLIYTRWFGLPTFQQTRGVLRVFALALRDSALRRDPSPLISTSAFLANEVQPALSAAARELVQVAQAQHAEGGQAPWDRILQKELEKAIAVQGEITNLQHREIESAVMTVFLCSQSGPRKAQPRDIMLMVGATRPDKILLEKGLVRWTATSWYLDEGFIQESELETGGVKAPPQSWRLGPEPNLRQMHESARDRIRDEDAETILVQQIRSLRSLTDGARTAGAHPHNLPDFPRQIEDDGDLHYAVLGPRAALSSGRPDAWTRRFIDETTGPDNPRIFQNAVILAAPSRDGLELARLRVRDLLAWEAVEGDLNSQDPGWKEKLPFRARMLTTSLNDARKALPEAIRQSYCMVITLGENNEVHSFKISINGGPLFNQIKADRRSRLQESAVSPDALLPGGPYELWKEGEKEHYVRFLSGAFGREARLPKMLSRRAVLDTLVEGCKEGLFVITASRSGNTYWREEPPEGVLEDPDAKVVLPEFATLTRLQASLLAPEALPELWSAPEITLRDISNYFVGGRVIMLPKEGYEEPLTIPRAEPGAIERAIKEAVVVGNVWLLSGQTSLWKEALPEGILTDEIVLRGPPEPIPVTSVLPENLSGAWSAGTTDARRLAKALSESSTWPLPWMAVRAALEGAFRARLIEFAPGSGPLQCDYSGAHLIKLRLPQTAPPDSNTTMGGTAGKGDYVVTPRAYGKVAEAELKLDEVQNLADQLAAVKKAAAGLTLRFHFRLELDGDTDPPEDVVKQINSLLEEVSDRLQLH